MLFNDKKVFVTGASRGIGFAIAKAFQKEGAWVVGTNTGKKSDKNEFCQEWVIADFTDINQIESCAEYLKKTKPDILVNNAGINVIAPFVDILPEDFLSIQQVNVYAPFRLCQAAIPAMKQRTWGRIINISSIWGKISKEFRASYSTSKFALDGMTLAMAAEHASDGININCIAPGFIDTELTRSVLGVQSMNDLVSFIPAKRLGKVDEIAQLVLWLASESNTYITGQNIPIDGGFTRV